MPSDSPDTLWTISKLITWTRDYFVTHGIDSPRMTAEILLSHCLDISRIDLYLQYDKPMTAQELSRFKSLIKRRTEREPVAYITGSKGFWTLDLDVSPRVLIPRPDTECLVEKALCVIPEKKDDAPMTILDLGTGSGAIILALASERPGHCYVAVDISLGAVSLAAMNKKKNRMDANVFFVNGSWFEPFKKKPGFDVIVSNPPYIPNADIEELEPEVRQYEPRLALDGDVDGLSCLRLIVDSASNYLKDGGYLFMEMGFDQKEAVRGLFEGHACYGQVEFFKDYAGLDRVVKVRKIQCI
ncbi:MAG: peptide chain release factor N(5)-glutamine methyltransferase [Proteobacteria bacterium]|nr:peptide chain release factor N(5)-glutamine methyltransferase [Pseudomonadota bacterium]